MSLLQRNGADRNAGERLGSQRAAGEGGTEPAPAGSPAPSRELIEHAKRRRFTADYKLAILAEAEAAREPGEVGALLRREGLYSSHLTWRRQRDEGALLALSCPRGRKPEHPLHKENQELRLRLGEDRGRPCQGPPGDRGPGKRLRASGRALGAQGRQAREEHRAMIQETVEKLAPLVGTRPACG